MKDTQNDFYSSISKYYPEIFPYNQAQLKYVAGQTRGLKGRSILDIGCATGELAFELANEGAEVKGIDLNEDLLLRAQSAKVHPGLTFRKADMLNLRNDFQSRQFDAVVCFGNTLVHLPSEDKVATMLSGVEHVLKPGGAFLLQILNYDYILDNGIAELPVIETENIKFVRRYNIKPTVPVIGFQTELHLKNEGRTIENETPLLAIGSRTLVRLLEETGFEKIMLYSSFKEDAFGGKHLPLVASAFKRI